MPEQTLNNLNDDSTAFTKNQQKNAKYYIKKILRVIIKLFLIIIIFLVAYLPRFLFYFRHKVSDIGFRALH